MSNLKKWRQLGQGAFQKWDTVGMKITGRWVGKHDGQFGPLGSVETDEGKVTFPLHTALLDLDGLPEGTEVAITYLGMKMSKKGKEFKNFSLQARDVEDDAPPRVDEDRRGNDEEAGVPF